MGSSASVPDLTGVPIASIAYLDRPSQAGYFVFPDLSVRHEGLYRLRFHLYEETKDPKDADYDTRFLPIPQQYSQSTSSAGLVTTPRSFLKYRLDVRSVPFVVYSAKRFPGLTTSTSLSHIIAEQGCRVRIRRDVRMKRREEKNGGIYDEDHDMSPHSRTYASPSDKTNRHTVQPDRDAYAGLERQWSTVSDNASLSPYHPELEYKRANGKVAMRAYHALS